MECGLNHTNESHQTIHIKRHTKYITEKNVMIKITDINLSLLTTENPIGLNITNQLNTGTMIYTRYVINSMLDAATISIRNTVAAHTAGIKNSSGCMDNTANLVG